MEEVAQNDAGVKGVDEEVEEMEDEEGDEEVDAAAADKETTNSPGDARKKLGVVIVSRRKA